MLKRIPIEALKPGMYVNRVLEQTGSLRMRSKGIVKNNSIIDTLVAKGILAVEVDTEKSTVTFESIPNNEAIPNCVQSVPVNTPLTRTTINSANALYLEAIKIQKDFLSALKKEAAKDLKPVEDLAHSLIDSIFNNKNALSCLTQIRQTDTYLLEHSINCCILMGMFTQYLGYDRVTIEQASLGALLMDVGMSAIPEDVHTNSSDLSSEHWEIIKTHVNIGVERVKQCGNVSEITQSIIAQHHERIDGSGYPNGLKGEDISIFARLAAIIDAYDAMTSNRPHKKGITPTQALKRLTNEDNLDKDFVSQFIQCIGVHPIGSLVKLKSGKLGMVCQQGKSDLLSPVVMTFYSINSNHYNEIKRVDLSKVDDEIVSGVRPDDFNINLPKFFKDVFIHQAPE